MSEHNIAALCQRSRDISLEKGWLNPDGTDPRPFHTVIALFHTELSEAFEDIRNNKGLAEVWYEGYAVDGAGGKQVFTAEKYARLAPTTPWKPCGFPVELADFVIRVCQYYGSANLGGKLERVMFELTALQVVELNVPEEAEQLIAHLHACCSSAYVDRDVFGTDSQAPTPIHHLATALLLLFGFCKKTDIDIWTAIDEKEAYNRTRSHKHGGKKV